MRETADAEPAKRRPILGVSGLMGQRQTSVGIARMMPYPAKRVASAANRGSSLPCGSAVFSSGLPITNSVAARSRMDRTLGGSSSALCAQRRVETPPMNQGNVTPTEVPWAGSRPVFPSIPTNTQGGPLNTTMPGTTFNSAAVTNPRPTFYIGDSPPGGSTDFPMSGTRAEWSRENACAVTSCAAAAYQPRRLSFPAIPLKRNALVGSDGCDVMGTVEAPGYWSPDCYGNGRQGRTWSSVEMERSSCVFAAPGTAWRTQAPVPMNMRRKSTGFIERRMGQNAVACCQGRNLAHMHPGGNLLRLPVETDVPSPPNLPFRLQDYLLPVSLRRPEARIKPEVASYTPETSFRLRPITDSPEDLDVTLTSGHVSDVTLTSGGSQDASLQHARPVATALRRNRGMVNLTAGVPLSPAGEGPGAAGHTHVTLLTQHPGMRGVAPPAGSPFVTPTGSRGNQAMMTPVQTRPPVEVLFRPPPVHAENFFEQPTTLAGTPVGMPLFRPPPTHPTNAPVRLVLPPSVQGKGSNISPVTLSKTPEVKFMASTPVGSTQGQHPRSARLQGPRAQLNTPPPPSLGTPRAQLVTPPPGPPGLRPMAPVMRPLDTPQGRIMVPLKAPVNTAEGRVMLPVLAPLGTPWDQVTVPPPAPLPGGQGVEPPAVTSVPLGAPGDPPDPTGGAPRDVTQKGNPEGKPQSFAPEGTPEVGAPGSAPAAGSARGGATGTGGGASQLFRTPATERERVRKIAQAKIEEIMPKNLRCITPDTSQTPNTPNTSNTPSSSNTPSRTPNISHNPKTKPQSCAPEGTPEVGAPGSAPAAGSATGGATETGGGASNRFRTLATERERVGAEIDSIINKFKLNDENEDVVKKKRRRSTSGDATSPSAAGRGRD